MKKIPDTLNVTTLCKSKLFSIEQVTLSFQNNEQRDYERIIAPGNGAVLIIPVVDASTLLMISEYCVGTNNYQLLFPKGRIDQGESIEQAANRELMEETGYGAAKLTRLHAMSIAPGYLDFITHIVLAQDLYEQKLQGDEPEALEVEKIDLHAFDKLMQRSDLTEARSIAALYIARDHLAKATYEES